MAGNRRPLADAPLPNQALGHIGIGPGEALSDGRALSLEQEDRAVDRVGEGAPQDQVTAFGGGPGLGQVGRSELGSPLQVIGADFVEQQVVPDGFCLGELFQMAEATYENLKGRRLVVDGVVMPSCL